MKIRFFILSVVLLFSVTAEAQQELTIKWDYSKQTFGEFAASAEKELGLRFFYSGEWVKDLKPGDFPGINQIPELLDNLFRGRSLFWFTDNSGNLVITRNFAVKIPGTGSPADSNYIPPSDYNLNGPGRELTENSLFEIGNPSERNRPGNVTISGYVINRDTREPVAGATILVQKLFAGTTSNDYGFYSLTLSRGIHLLQFSFIGMREKQISVNLFGQGELNVEMNSMLIPLKETTVSAVKNITLKRYETGMEKINISSFRLMPTSLGESDIIKSVLLIPGVQTVGEGSAGFNVRGGSSDQNLIMIYGAPVYNSSHFFGFFSAVNPDIIKDATLYKGGIPSRYGGRISSVFDIVSKEGNKKEYSGNAGISPITTHVMIEGPIKKDTCSFIVAGRTTYSDWLLKLINYSGLKKSMASFYDINGKITYDISKDDRIELSSYISHDSFRFQSDTLYSYNNNIQAVRWRHFYNRRLFSVISLNNSHYMYEISGMTRSPEAFKMAHSINSTGLKADFNWYKGRSEVNYGLDLTYYSVLPGSYKPAADSSLVIPKVIQRQRGLETGAYIDEKFILTENISINGGLRISSYHAVGPESYYLYDKSRSRNPSNRIDTVQFAKNRIYKNYAGPEFRISLNFRTSLRSSLKINYNRTRQYLHLLSNTTSISPTDTWKLSDYYLKPQIGDQYALGFYQILFNNRLETSAELYYKEVKNMSDFKDGTRLIMNENITEDLVNVKGKAYGLEMMVRKDGGKFRWSVGYTYSRTFLKSSGRFPDEIINKNGWFPASFDKPNDLSVTLNYLFSRRISFVSGYTWSTGRPVTYPVSTYYMDNLLLIHYSDRNKYRIPDYMRLDVSLKISGNLRSHKLANPHWIFSVYNLLGRKNVYSVYFKNENGQITGYKLSVFGQAIPSVSFNFDF